MDFIAVLTEVLATKKIVMAMANAMNLCDKGVEQTLEELLPKPVDSKEEFMVLETRLIAEEDYRMKLVCGMHMTFLEFWF